MKEIVEINLEEFMHILDKLQKEKKRCVQVLQGKTLTYFFMGRTDVTSSVFSQI
jgi:hypothetical protein